MNPLDGASFLRNYIESNKKLCRTMVIKSSVAVQSLNDFIRLKYGESSVDPYDPSSWKYYQNISGEYHPLDTLMTVTSLDTLEEISFTKENLSNHSTTKQAYAYGTRYYYSLLKKFPEQEQLILGILYPCDKQKAIDATDGTILSYPTELIEPQEATLVEELEGFIKRHHVRWNVQAFGLSDSLYNTSYYAMLYLSLLPKLFNLRLKRCKTNEAHSFHIRQYLSSHKRLDKYMPYLTLKQTLYLYRNIRYLERNTGRVNILDELIAKILTDRRVPIAEYTVRQLNSFDDEYYPQITARRKPLNLQFNNNEKAYVDIYGLYDKEKQLVYGNDRYYVNSSVNDEYLFKNSDSSVIKTKDLESNMIDYNDAVPDPLEMVLMRQWIFMATNGLYDVVVNFKDPKTGELMSLYAVDALIYYIYVSMNAIGVPIDKVPSFVNLKYRKWLKPSVSYLTEVVDSKYKDMPAIAQDILDAQPEYYECFSNQMFFDLNFKIYEEGVRHWFMISNTHDMERRAAINQMTLRLYEDTKLSFDRTGENIDSWLSSKNLLPYDYDIPQAKELLREIFTEVTGLNLDETKLLKNIQRMLISLLTDLSSYSIQIIQEINQSKIRPLNWAAIRTGNHVYGADAFHKVPVNLRVYDSRGQSNIDVYIETNNADIQSVFKTNFATTYSIPTELTMVNKMTDSRFISIPFGSFKTNATYSEYDPAVSGQAGYIGKEHYLSLTDEQKSELKSIYN